MGLSIIGFDLHRLLKLSNCLVDFSAQVQNRAQVVVGLRVVGLDFQRLPVMSDGRVNLSAASQG